MINEYDFVKSDFPFGMQVVLMLHTDCLLAEYLLFFKAHAHPGTHNSLMILQLMATISNLQLFNSSEKR